MANWIFKMVYLTMQCITVATSLRTAFCITGQQVRLELFSKIRYLFLPHQRAFGPDSLHVVMVLSNSSFLAKPDKSYGDMSDMRDTWPLMSPQESAAMLDLMQGLNLSVSLQYIDWNLHSVAMPDQRDQPSSWPHGRRRSMSQWNTCLKTLRAHELSAGKHYDVVFKIREDSLFLHEVDIAKMHEHINKLAPRKGMLAIGCRSWGGWNDNVFVLGRQAADVFFDHVMEDLDWTFASDRVHEPTNTERWVKEIQRKYHIPVKEVSIC